MHALPTAFDDRVFHYTQVEREGDIAIFCQTHTESHCARFEVIKIRVQPAHTWPNGTTSPEREAYPGSGSWGSLGWTCFTLQAAQELARTLRAAQDAASPHSQMDRRHGAWRDSLPTIATTLQRSRHTVYKALAGEVVA